jgi:hypothetical protein
MLDCDTPRGQVFMARQDELFGILNRLGYTVIATKGKSHPSDAILAKTINGQLTLHGVAEIKTRQRPLTIEYIRDNGYLISDQKIRDGRKNGIVLGVAFYVIVKIVDDPVIFVWKITQPDGQYCFAYQVKQTQTKANCNGGVAIRMNAFLPYEHAKVITCT